MAKFSLTLLMLGTCLATKTCFTSARRTKVSVVSSVLASARGMENVKAFSEACAAMGPQGEAAGKLVENLEEGVEGTITGSTLTRPNSEGYKLEVTHSKVNQGEIATPSKVPVLWTLELTTTYTFQPKNEDGRYRLYVSGIKLLPFREGREMYEASGAQAACASQVETVAQVQCERQVLYKWYAGQWSTHKKSAYIDYNTHPERKLGRILKGMYGSTMNYRAIKFGGSGDEAWEKILYALVTIAPVEIDFFEFLANSNKYKEVEMAMQSHAIFEGTYAAAGGLDLADYDGLGFKVKNGAEFDPDAFESQRSKGERFARSGLNFGAMTAKGSSDDILNLEKVRGGTAEYILNFASPCIKKNKLDSNNDPTEGCRDDKGRVFWY